MSKKEPHNSYKDLYEETCEHLLDLCKLLNIDTHKEMADEWAIAGGIQRLQEEVKKYKEALYEIGWTIPKDGAKKGTMEYNTFKSTKMGRTARKALGYIDVGAPEIF